MFQEGLYMFDKSDFPGAEETTAEKGSFLLMEGHTTGQSAYLLLSGEVEVFVGDVDGSETLLFKLGPGHLVGEMGLLGVQQRMAYVRCLTPVHMLRLSKRIWGERMQDEEFLRKLLDSVVLRFAATQSVVRRLGQSQAAHRLGVYLLGLKEWGYAKGDQVLVELPTHANMARMLNCTREHVTKVIKRFTQADAIIMSGDGRNATLSRVKISELLTSNRSTSR